MSKYDVINMIVRVPHFWGQEPPGTDDGHATKSQCEKKKKKKNGESRSSLIDRANYCWPFQKWLV